MTTKLIPLIMTLCAAVAFDASARYKGDLNGDDRVDLTDIVYLAKAISSGSTDKALDVNASGKVDDYDLHKLADIIILKTLTEDGGLNVGIGGWDDTGEDYGGSVKAPALTTHSVGDVRFYMNSPKEEGDDRYSMEFGIAEGNEAPCAILFNIRLPREMRFDASKIVELEQWLKASHSLYGTPVFVKENENDEWSEYSLRFILFSPDLKAMPLSSERFGRIFYSVGSCWDTPVFVNCQMSVADVDGCIAIPDHESDYNGDFKPSSVACIIERNAPCDIYTVDGKSIMSGVHLSEINNLHHGVYIILQYGKTTKLLK